MPAADSPAAGAPAPEGAGLEAEATYMGAFEPGGDDWTVGWTAFPAN